MFALDGNNSLKRVKMSEKKVAGDVRELDDTSYYLSREYVDRFSREVRGRQPKNLQLKGKRKAGMPEPEENGSDLEGASDSESVDGDPTDGIHVSVTDSDMTVPSPAPLQVSSPSPPPSSLSGTAAPPPPTATLPEPSSSSASTLDHSSTGTVPTESVDDALKRKMLEQCVKNWKAAASEEKKKMWGMFDESGIFASACRHSLLLWIVDMVQSGEL